jgi:hypothetical protein
MCRVANASRNALRDEIPGIWHGGRIGGPTDEDVQYRC